MTATAILELEDAGFTRRQVEGIARLLETQTATKADLFELKAELRAEMAEVRREVAELRAHVDLKIADAKAELVRWVVGVGFAQVATILAVLKLFPGGHP